MALDRTLYLCGAGNSEGVRLALTINRRSSRWGSLAILDDDRARWGQRLLGVEVVGGFDVLAGADPARDEVANLVARTTARRRAARAKLASYGIPFATLIHPGVDTLGATLARELIVYEGAILAPEVEIGEGTVLFMNAVAGHECRIGECCVLAAGSVLNARVVLEDGVYVGTNAAILPELRVGEGATVGACSSVVHDVPAGATAIGVPAEVVGARRAARAEPRDPDTLERAMAPVWAAVLGRASIGATESFFDAGGNSLLALQTRARLAEVLGLELAVTDLFRFPTLRALSIHLARVEDAPLAASDRALAPREVRRVLARR
ncbi:MAG: hypothetical protein KF729_29770 [Sandaracinaceae bacterium]|nr:hypothetical protein [Sandaracinaceae bacterium]